LAKNEKRQQPCVESKRTRRAERREGGLKGGRKRKRKRITDGRIIIIITSANR
jgi:hypothetical protein